MPAVIDRPLGSSPKNAEPKSDFDWNIDDSVILREQPATAVYFNKNDDLVIRQKRWPEDAFIYISAESLDTFLDKLSDACGIPSIGKSK